MKNSQSQEEAQSNNFKLLLQLRSLFKRVGQATWSAKQAEDRWLIGNPEAEKNLVETYISLVEEIKDTLASVNLPSNDEIEASREGKT